MLFADILADPKRFDRSDQELEILAEIKKNVQTINDITTRVLEFTGQDIVENLPVDINVIIQTVLRLWTPIIKQAGINVDFSPQPDLPSVLGDRIALQQALGNLVRNGIEAMNRGGSLTLITSLVPSSLPEQEEKVVISCRDTGPGIEEGLKNLIFDPFFSSKPSNSGLGLTIARQIVKRHGGRLVCSSSNAKQTVFCIELPIGQGLDSKRNSS